MRKLVDAEDGKKARQLVDRLLVEGIEAQVRPDGGVEVWVIEEDDLQRARAIATGRTDGVTPDVVGIAEAIRRDKHREQTDHEQRFIDMSTRWRGIPGLGIGAVSAFLIAGSIVVALVSFFGDADVDPMWSLTIDHWASTEPLQRVREGEVWRLLTPMFLHFGIFHLLFNMAWVYRFGPQVEAGHGSLTLVVLVVVSEVVGNLGQYYVTGPAFGGMSGVVYALFGFVWMNARYNRRYRYDAGGRTILLAMAWFVLCAFGVFGPVANIGHAGGLVVGLLFGMPAFIRHVRARGTTPDFEDGSWADLHLTGFRRFERRFLRPYVPVWFLLIGIGVVALEHHNKGPREIDTGVPACDEYLRRVSVCFVDEGGDPEALIESMEHSGILDDPDRAETICQEQLEALRPSCGAGEEDGAL